MAAWQELFDEVFVAEGWGPAYRAADYYALVDGRSRYDGVQAVIQSRGQSWPWGDPSDEGDVRTVCGLANRKNCLFQGQLAAAGVSAYPGTSGVLEALRRAGKRLAVVSSSRNAGEVLAAAGLAQFFALVVDGRLAEERVLPGKPAPDTFWYAARELGLTAARCVVIEDAVAGVGAGRAGGFGLVVGVDRGAGARALFNAGAGQVVTDLSELLEPMVGIRS
jgi:HAD superfamily hydrolase (TIGR01509 family)